MNASAPESRGPRPVPTPERLIEELKELLDVEELDTGLYRGARQKGGRGRVFGGQVIAQALMAAAKSTDPGRRAHSLHAYFMRAGDEALPIIYRVVRDFDGRSFSNRRIIAMQRGEPILNMTASFHVPEEGMAHQDEMPDVPPPESIETQNQFFERHRDSLPERMARWLTRPRAIEIRPIDPEPPMDPRPRPAVGHAWFRAAAPLDADPAMHRAVLAYATDMTLLGTCLLPHGVNWIRDELQTTSLDHAVWLHEDLRADDWLLYATDSPWAGHARGFNRGRIFTREGRLVASVAQEGLVRRRRSAEART